jgi:hypothetical protein
MAKGAFQPTAELLAQQYNLNRGRNDPSLPAARFNPYHEDFRASIKAQLVDDRELRQQAWKGFIGG